MSCTRRKGTLVNPEINYPPGIDRRLIDWVRFPISDVTCSVSKCSDLDTRETDIGIFCLICYMDLPSCNEPGCHRPAMEYISDPGNNKKRRKSWIPQCRDHYYDPEAEREYLHEQRQRLQQGSSHSNGATY